MNMAACVCTYAYKYVCTSEHDCMYSICTYECVPCDNGCLCIYVRTYVYTCDNGYLCMYVCVHTYVNMT